MSWARAQVGPLASSDEKRFIDIWPRRGHGASGGRFWATLASSQYFSRQSTSSGRFCWIDAERVLTHRSAWESGNHEDGYLTGVDNIIRILKDMEAETLR